MTRRFAILIPAAIAAAVIVAHAPRAAAAPPRGFDVKGFTQGMHRRDAEAVAKRRHTQLTWVVEEGGRLVAFASLFGYTYAVHGGFMQFLRQIKSFEGQGYRRTNLDLGTQMQPDGKEAGHLTLYLFRPDDYYYVTITLLGTEDDDTDRLALQYEALDKGAKCRKSK